MTRKDFELIAQAFSDMRPPKTHSQSQWLNLCRHFADILVNEAEGRFDRARFLKACGAE